MITTLPREADKSARRSRGLLWAAAVRWEIPASLLLLALTAVLYIWGLSASGWANAYYTAAVQAGATSWKAFFFGSFDASNFITVDKPPAALWVMALSVRLFGLSSWSVLLPQALEGVAAVAVLYLAVRRWFGPVAGLLAGLVMAVTPVAVLMFRFNNPDALLTLLLVCSAYALMRAVESGGSRWLLACGALVGLGFLTKMMQAFLVLPAFVLVYLWAAPGGLAQRVRQLLLGGAAMLLSAGWWVAAVEFWPASQRPYIGGSQNNSLLNLIWGYNGLGRLTGNEVGSVGGFGGNGGRWGPTGLLRLFGAEMGGQISWLLPAALLGCGVLFWLSWKRPRTDRTRAFALLWGGWLLVTGLVFSYAQGIIHPYYTVALAPAVGALVGTAATTLWSQRSQLWSRTLLALGLSGTSLWAFVLLARTPSWLPWLRMIVLVGGLVLAGVLLCAPYLRRRMAALAVATALAVALAGPSAYAVQTASTPHTGALPSAGPAMASGGGRFGGGPAWRAGMFSPNGGFTPPVAGNANAGLPPSGANGSRGGAGWMPSNRGLGGLLDAGSPSRELVQLLREDAEEYTWVAATVGANSAAGLQLATEYPVMAIGGFNGNDPAPTLEQFQQWVREGKVHYFLAGGMGGGMGGTGTASQITQWVEANFQSKTVGGVVVYDLTKPISGAQS